MKIIKKGILEVKKLTCDECGCIFKYNKTDVDKRAFLNTDSGIEEVYYVICPTCYKEIEVEPFKSSLIFK